MNAVLHASYMRVKLAEKFTMAYDEIGSSLVRHVATSIATKETGVSRSTQGHARLQPLHPPTMLPARCHLSAHGRATAGPRQDDGRSLYGI